MPATKVGFEGKIYYGVAGSTAATEITNSRDITESFGSETGETTVRGSGSSPPIVSARTTALTYSLKWTMLNKSGDTTLAALVTAATSGNPVAIRTKAYDSGKGVDGDVLITMERGMPLKGEATLDFTAVPNNDTRDFQLDV